MDNGNDVKENIPIYTDECEEFYLETLKEFLNVVNTYELWVNDNEVLVYGKFHRCLRGDAMDIWDQIIVNNPARTLAEFKKKIDAMSVEILGFDTFED